MLVSGGLDSATVLAMARADDQRCVAVSFDYGQRHRCELEAAAALCSSLGVADHRTVRIDPAPLAGSTLTGPGPVPSPDASKIGQSIPATYVPARNTVFLSLALAMAEGEAADRIYIGANAVDYSGYPDCRPAFIEAFQEVVDVGTKAGVEGRGIRIEAPLLRLTKAQIIAEGLRLGVDYGLTSSCYNPAADGKPCGLCESCMLRMAGFGALGMEDPRLAVWG